MDQARNANASFWPPTHPTREIYRHGEQRSWSWRVSAGCPLSHLLLFADIALIVLDRLPLSKVDAERGEGSTSALSEVEGLRSDSGRRRLVEVEGYLAGTS